MRTTFEGRVGEDTVVVRLGSVGLHIEFPDGSQAVAPGAELQLPLQRLKSWIDFGHRLYCNDASLGELVIDMQDEEDSASVARMMMTLALRLRDAQNQSNVAQAEDAEQPACSAAPPLVPLPNDAGGEQRPATFSARARRRESDDGPMADGCGAAGNRAQDHVQSPTVATTECA